MCSFCNCCLAVVCKEASCGIRTHDVPLTERVLCQLSWQGSCDFGRTSALIYMRLQAYELHGLASAITSVVPPKTSTSPISRWFGVSAGWCEHRAVCAPLSRHRSNGTLQTESRYCNVARSMLCESACHDGLRLSLETRPKHLSTTLLGVARTNWM